MSIQDLNNERLFVVLRVTGGVPHEQIFITAPAGKVRGTKVAQVVFMGCSDETGHLELRIPRGRYLISGYLIGESKLDLQSDMSKSLFEIKTISGFGIDELRAMCPKESKARNGFLMVGRKAASFLRKCLCRLSVPFTKV